jgi:hypothetical protein
VKVVVDLLGKYDLGWLSDGKYPCIGFARLLLEASPSLGAFAPLLCAIALSASHGVCAQAVVVDNVLV